MGGGKEVELFNKKIVKKKKDLYTTVSKALFNSSGYMQVCLYVHVCRDHRLTSVVFLNHCPPYILRQALTMGLENEARLPGEQASGILSQFHQRWNCTHMPP